MKRHCEACGARLAPEDEQCGLCGTPAGVRPEDLEHVDLEVEADTAAAADSPESDDAGDSAVFCNQCGWKNPPGSRFCSKCGSAVRAVDADPGDAPAPPSAPPSPAAADKSKNEDGVGRQVGIIIGAAVLVILVLYMISAMRSNGNAVPQAPPPPVPQQSVAQLPLPEGVITQAAALDDSIAAATGETALQFKRRKVDLYLSAGRVDLAGEVQEEVARETGQEVDWAFAGNLYYDTMDRLENGSDDRVVYAKRAIASYQEVLAINPSNLDVMTDMAVAYMSDPDNPMAAIQNTQAVLQQDSLHVQANFNRGIMLSQIGRNDQAIEQFRKVQRIIGDPENVIYQRAGQAIEQIQPIG